METTEQTGNRLADPFQGRPNWSAEESAFPTHLYFPSLLGDGFCAFESFLLSIVASRLGALAAPGRSPLCRLDD